MKLLVFGKTGQVARELQRLAPDATYLGREDADLLNPTACAAAIAATDADAIINAAAWTAVDKAETEEPAATVVNGDAPTAMARAAAAKGLPFLHISTDYVFDGTGDQPFTPDHQTAPLGVYGRSKLAGEQGVRAAGGNHLILRTSWVVSSHGANFVKTMLRLGAEREALRNRQCASDRRKSHDPRRGRRHPPLLRRAGHQLGQLRPGHHGRGRSSLPDQRHPDRRIPHPGQTTVEFSP
jgi:dTDP-4-dehydrorhamnose reductase